MFEHIGITYGYSFKMLERIIPVFSLVPFVFVAYPFSEPLVQHLEQPSHFGLSEHAVIVEPSTYFEL